MTTLRDMRHVRHDGDFCGVAEQWTDMDPDSPAYGASFCAKPGEDVATKLAELRQRFAGEGAGVD